LGYPQGILQGILEPDFSRDLQQNKKIESETNRSNSRLLKIEGAECRFHVSGMNENPQFNGQFNGEITRRCLRNIECLGTSPNERPGPEERKLSCPPSKSRKQQAKRKYFRGTEARQSDTSFFVQLPSHTRRACSSGFCYGLCHNSPNRRSTDYSAFNCGNRRATPDASLVSTTSPVPPLQTANISNR
jgi:hypothetical protein